MWFELKRLILLEDNIQQIEVFFTITNTKISIDILHSIPFNDYEHLTFASPLNTLFKEHSQNEDGIVILLKVL